MKTYNGYEMEKITQNTIRIRRIGGEWIDMWGHYPKSFKEAKLVIDEAKLAIDNFKKSN